MIQFILNDKLIRTDLPEGTTVLDFIRYEQHLTGTKIGCREGDCGACAILSGDIRDNTLKYESITSCLMPLRNAHGKHIVTVEGFNQDRLNPVQQAIVEEGATQCGFCTPGFVVSLSGYMLNEPNPVQGQCITAMDGNICRCTGYKSLERAAGRIVAQLKSLQNPNHIQGLIDSGYIPPWFGVIPERLNSLQQELTNENGNGKGSWVGGGTDLWVQKPEEMAHSSLNPVFVKKHLRNIFRDGEVCVVGAVATATDFAEEPLIQSILPGIEDHMKLVSSTPIRNMGTIGGNLINASPIGDMTILFLALDSQLILNNRNLRRTIPLKDFYLGYKKMDKHPDELLEQIRFRIPQAGSHFNFEKVCKRTHLDIASVNSAALIRMGEGVVESMHVSAGGVSPVPLYLTKTCDFMTGKKVTIETLKESVQIMQSEISPISDARGSERYKRELMARLFLAHWWKCMPGLQKDLADILKQPGV